MPNYVWKIYDPVRVGEFCIRSNNELFELFNDFHVVQCFNIQQLRRLDCVDQIEEENFTKVGGEDEVAVV